MEYFSHQRFKLTDGQDDLREFLEIVGELLAYQEGYGHYKGIEAIQYWLVERHHWTPAQVRGLSLDDLMFLTLEHHPLQLPGEAGAGDDTTEEDGLGW